MLSVLRLLTRKYSVVHAHVDTQCECMAKLIEHSIEHAPFDIMWSN